MMNSKHNSNIKFVQWLNATSTLNVNFFFLCFWNVNWVWVILPYTYPIFLKAYIANSMKFSQKNQKLDKN